MISLVTNRFFDILIPILLSASFPASLYLWGMWSSVERNDVRVVVRNTLSVLLVITNAIVVLAFAIHLGDGLERNFGILDHIGTLCRYTGVNLPLPFLLPQKGSNVMVEFFNVLIDEIKFSILGIIIVNSLFFGSLVQNLLEFCILRNVKRSSIISIMKYRQRQLNSTSIPITEQLEQAEFPKYLVHPIYEVIWYEIVNFGDILDQNSQIDTKTPILTQILNTFNLYLCDVKKGIETFKESLNITSLKQIDRVYELDRLVTLRSLIVVPIAEEVLYRGTLYPFLLHYMISPSLTSPPAESYLFYTIMYSGILFAASHLHHFVRHYRDSGSIPKAFLIVFVQFIYCFLFAMFCGFIYALPLLTNPKTFTVANHSAPQFSLTAAIICHSICNSYGLPDIDFYVDSQSNLYRFKWPILCSYLFGVFTFIFLLCYLPR